MAMIGYALLGMIMGGYIAAGGHIALGIFGGAAVALLFRRLHQLHRRLEDLERAAPPRAAPLEPAAARPAKPHAPPAPEPDVDEWPVAATPAAPAGAPATLATEPVRADRAQAAAVAPRTDLEPLRQALRKIPLWFTRGNVPVKVGVLVTFIGVSFLLKYAIDHKLIFLPIEFRLLGVALFGGVLLLIGWRLRKRMRVYALSLQGGGVGIVFLTIFAAFRIWALLPPLPAFVLLAALAAGTAVLALLQNARSLAILATTGGFLAPVLASTGQGSHVLLFSYYLVLNAAILAIAWFKAWRELNLIGFVFTFIIGSAWGYRFYRPDLFASTEPFLILHFLLYTAVAVLFALRQKPDRVGWVDGTLVFGTPVVCSALQAALLSDSEYGLAISAAAVAGLYAALAVALFRRHRQAMRLLVESFIALAVAFATLAIPLALDARWTAAAWALEGAALVWVGMRQSHHLANLAGFALLFLSGAAFADHGWRHDRGWPILNGNVLGGALIALASLFSARQLQGQHAESQHAARNHKAETLHALYRLGTWAAFAWGIAWWLGTGLAEALDRVTRFSAAHVYLAFLAASALLAERWSVFRPWPALRYAGALLLPLMALLGVYSLLLYQHNLFGFGWLAWPAAWAAQGWALWRFDAHRSRLAGPWHFGSALLLVALLASEAWWQTGRGVPGAWAEAAAIVTVCLAALSMWRMRNRPAWPVPRHPAEYLDSSILCFALALLFLAARGIDSPGDPAPLPYLPLLNPFDLAMLAAGVTGWLSLRAIDRDRLFDTRAMIVPLEGVYRALLALAAFVLTTTAVVRAVHHLGEVPWYSHALSQSVRVQTALSIYWGVLGFSGMLWGARRGRRAVWVAGAGFMALVVVKLFLVDLGNTGTVERIVSFMGIGALLLVVGYFAPAPPRVPGEGRGPEPPQ